MSHLSSPIQDLKTHYTVVVIGSGYGGAIAASRLARAGQTVCVLERGKEFQPGDYPNTEGAALREMQVDSPKGHHGSCTGLYDLRVNKDMHVIVGCGLGGTSLINANVSLQADPRVFDDPCWPQALRDDLSTLVAEGYQRAEEMLRPTPYPEHFPTLSKLQALEKSSEHVGGKFYRTPINVTFTDGPNQVGVEQRACTLCGDCVSGCNHGAKNTVLMNYLPDAKNHGAEIYTQVSVQRVERTADQWLVYYQILDAGRERFDAPTLFVSADIVILAAGTLGSTEILLRSKAAGLPVSDQVGQRFSGNGDVLAFGYNNDQEINGVGFGDQNPEDRAPVGPCITGIIDQRDQPDVNSGMVIEEGAIPGAVSAVLPASLATAAQLLGRDTDSGIVDAVQEHGRELASIARGAYHGALRNTQTYLVMAHDNSAGRLYLENDRLRIAWPGGGSQPVFRRIDQRLEQVTQPLGGTYVRNPVWSKPFDYDLITVHPLGGCAMADSGEHGGVNHKGQVFIDSQGKAVYEGLYVCDGAIIPRSLGVNPLLTISALAERTCALLAKDRGWTIDYDFTKTLQPTAGSQPMGLQFTETMRGYFSARVTDDYQRGVQQGKQDDSPLHFTLTVHSADVQHMLADPQHTATITGTVNAPALSPQPLTITQGTFHLFVNDSGQVKTRHMRYHMVLRAVDGNTYFFEGTKLIHDDKGFDIWSDTTTLFVTLYRGKNADSPVLGKGIVTIAPSDFVRQLTTIKVLHAKSTVERLRAIAQFGHFFAGSLYDVYGGIFARPTAFEADPVPREKRPLRLDPPEFYPVTTVDGVQIRLLRYQGGETGPVILSHAFGTSSLMYTLDTIETNFTEYLVENGYDVWVFDYRASADLPSASSSFSIDDIATKDYPAAVAKVLEVSGAESVQVVAHCVGAMSLLMALCSGMQGVRSAVCSQLSAHPVVIPQLELKAATHLPTILRALKMDTLSPQKALGSQLIASHFDMGRNVLSFFQKQGIDISATDVFNRLTDQALKLIPSPEQCPSPVCRRILLIYGEPYKHKQLNEATHGIIHEIFGTANLCTLDHISRMTRLGKIVDEKGKDVYLPHFDRLKLPISFIHGADNRQFLPETTARTYQLLCETNGADWYSRQVIPNYGHLDCLIGEKAEKDVFPIVLAELEKGNA